VDQYVYTEQLSELKCKVLSEESQTNFLKYVLYLSKKGGGDGERGIEYVSVVFLQNHVKLTHKLYRNK
jgi:hypothetical protein